MCRLLLLLLLPILLGASPPAILEGDTQTFLGPVKVVGDVFQWIEGVLSGTVRSTTSTLNLYVTTAGSDSATCLIGFPCLTINRDIGRIPKTIRHAVVVDIGAGNFGEFSVRDFKIEAGGSLTIQGTLGASTPTTGTASGTATAGSIVQLTDAGQTWTSDDLVGNYLQVAGEHRLIRANNGTVIDVTKAFSGSTNGKAYTIVTPTTVINSGTAYGQWISILNVHGYIGNTYTWVVKNFYVNNSTGVGVAALGVDNGKLEQLKTDGADFHGISVTDFSNMALDGLCSTNSDMYGVFIAHGSTLYSGDFHVVGSGWSGVDIFDVSNAVEINGYFKENIDHGLRIELSGYVSATYLYADENYWNGVYVSSTKFFGWTYGTASTNSEHGLQVDYLDNENPGDGNEKYSGSNVVVHTVAMNNNTNDAVQADNGSFVELRTVTGTGNTGFGINARGGSRVYFASTTTITGLTSDVTINMGTGSLTYAGNFSSNGDAEVDTDSGTRVIRRD